MIIRECSNCSCAVSSDGYAVDEVSSDTSFRFCSLSCLIEWAWNQRSAQPKLSKSTPVTLGAPVWSPLGFWGWPCGCTRMQDGIDRCPTHEGFPHTAFQVAPQ